MNHIVHLSSVHRADDSRIYVKECLTLQEAGYRVTLVAREPESDTELKVPLVKIDADIGNRFVRMTLTVLEVGRAALKIRGDAYHFHDPELLPVGVMLKLLGKKVIYDVHENVPKQISRKIWLPRLVRTPIALIVDRLERASARLFDSIICATPGIAERFPEDRTHVVQNFAVLSEFLNIDTSDYTSRARISVYLGGITEARGIRGMVQAAGRTKSTLLLGGRFTPASLQDEMKKVDGWAFVRYLGHLSRKGVQQALGQSRIGLVVLKPEPNYLDSYPIKLYEYMAAGLPVVASDFPFWHQFVVDKGAGLMVDPLNPDEIAEAVSWLLDHPEEAREMGARGREAAVASYSWEQDGQKLVEVYREIFQQNQAVRTSSASR